MTKGSGVSGFIINPWRGWTQTINKHPSSSILLEDQKKNYQIRIETIGSIMIMRDKAMLWIRIVVTVKSRPLWATTCKLMPKSGLYKPLRMGTLMYHVRNKNIKTQTKLFFHNLPQKLFLPCDFILSIFPDLCTSQFNPLSCQPPPHHNYFSSHPAPPFLLCLSHTSLSVQHKAT